MPTKDKLTFEEMKTLDALLNRWVEQERDNILQAIESRSNRPHTLYAAAAAEILASMDRTRGLLENRIKNYATHN